MTATIARTATATAATAGIETERAAHQAGLALDGVTVSYQDGTTRRTVVNDATLSIAPGTIVALTGESGSGKSTLLSVAAGLIVPDSGTVAVAGRELGGLSDNERAELRRDSIGIVFQQSNLIGSLTAAEQLLIMDHLRGVRPRAARADELLDFVGLGGLGTRRMGELSGGQRQRVNIARALMTDPAVLLADEPTSALDSARSAAIMDLLVQVTREWNTATMVVTHSGASADTADVAYLVTDGHVEQAS